jgi:drug/metabolite transporter (DMT)-like permease
MSRRGWLLFVMVGVVWGVPYLLIKISVTVLTPASLVFARTALAALLLVPLAAARGQLRPLMARWRPLLAFTLVELAVPWLLLSNAERRLSSSLAGLLIAAVPLVAAVLALLTGGERLGPRRSLGLGLGLAGVAALVGLDLGSGDAPALAQMAVVAVAYAVGPFILSRYLSDLPGPGVMAGALLLGAVGYAPVGLAQLPHHWPAARVVTAVAVLAVLCTAVAFLLFAALVREVGPVRATVVTYVNPAVAVALGVLLGGEPLTVGIGVGFALVLGGSVLATQRSRPRAARPIPADPARARAPSLAPSLAPAPARAPAVVAGAPVATCEA